MRAIVLMLVLCLVTAAEGSVVEQLASLDGRERDEARRQLYATIGVAELEGFRDDVAEMSASDRSVAREAIRAVVLHAFVRDESLRRQGEAQKQAFQRQNELTPGTGTYGFLGVSSTRVSWTRQVMPGVIFSRLIPGFVASQVFEDGDVITAVSQIRADGRGIGTTELREFNSLRTSVGGQPRGQTLRFFVQRGGRFVTRDVTLDTRIDPSQTALSLDAGYADVRAVAEEQWATDFAPLFE